MYTHIFQFMHVLFNLFIFPLIYMQSYVFLESPVAVIPPQKKTSIETLLDIKSLSECHFEPCHQENFLCLCCQLK